MLPDFLLKPWADRISSGVRLAHRTSMRVGGESSCFFQPRTALELQDFLGYLASQGREWLILGGGTNLIIGPDREDRPVIHLGEMQELGRDGRKVTVSAGTKLPRLVSWSISHGLAGLEGLSGIPGTVGGAVAMNCGGQFGEITDCLATVLVVLPGGEMVELTREELNPTYRSTDLRGGVVVSCCFELGEEDVFSLQQRAKEIAARKSLSQPLALRSAGCIFRNPGGKAAAAMIDEAGLKGLTVGMARVSRKHANFIVHEGGATAGQVLELMSRVRKEINERFQTELKLEVKVWP